MPNIKLYPLLFENNLHEKVWGGRRLKPMKGLGDDDEPIGESWEVSAIESSPSIIKNGPLAGKSLIDLTKEWGAELVGKKTFEKYGNRFPMLVKLIDAAKDLSIQVHPNDELAMQRHNCYGKTEMWYILDSEPGAFLYSGFKTAITKDEYEERIANGTITGVLQKYEVKAGDVFYIPAGRVHSICGGVLTAEVQQSSDITYRIFDYGRMGLDGKPRELHTELAKDAIDFTVLDDYATHYKEPKSKPSPVIQEKFFVVKLLKTKKTFHRNLLSYDTFVVYLCLQGNCKIKMRDENSEGTISLKQGNSCLVPASSANYDIIPDNDKNETKVLECYIDNKHF